jgi:class 3 adenylate cyclase/pimeloyl-ACP methyl ester carboxylesterase
MEIRDTRYATTPDGIYIAYQTAGVGPLDFVWQFDHTGDVDLAWEHPTYAPFFTGLAEFCRLILHDRRGTGLSSRNVAPPNLETRVSDLLSVLDEVGAERPVLAGALEGGTPNVLVAATNPERVRALVWFEPLPRVVWTPDFPWGVKPDYVALEERSMDVWGTNDYGRAWAETEATEGMASYEPELLVTGMLSRHTTTPDVARELSRIWHQTDVRGVLPSVQAPTLLIARAMYPDSVELTEYVASLMPDAVVAQIAGDYVPDNTEPILDIVRGFLGAERSHPELDAILSTVMFTDIVGSTERQAELGNRAWRDLVLRHHAIIRGALERWRGVENDTAGDGFYATFDGPARAIRCAQEVVEAVRPLGIEVRAGVHTGECELIEGKPAGLTVSIGARVAAHAGASEVLVSQTVKDLVAGSGLSFEDAGERELKGVPDRWRLYRVSG